MLHTDNGSPCTGRWRPSRRLSRSFVLVTLGLLSLGPFAISGAAAQAQPPDRFYGTVTVDGKQQSVGTAVDAYVGDTLCGSGSVEDRGGNVIYFVDVLGGGQKPGCAKDGDTVTFKVAGLSAKEKGTYQTGTATRLDLTASGTPKQEATQTVLPPGGGGTPAPPPPAPSASTPAVGTSTPPPPRVTATAGGTSSGATPMPTGTPSGPAAATTGTPAATATGTPSVSVTPAAGLTGIVTSTPHPLVAAAPLISKSKSSGPPAVVWVVIAIAILAALGGIGAWFYRQRTAA